MKPLRLPRTSWFPVALLACLVALACGRIGFEDLGARSDRAEQDGAEGTAGATGGGLERDAGPSDAGVALLDVQQTDGGNAAGTANDGGNSLAGAGGSAGATSGAGGSAGAASGAGGSAGATSDAGVVPPDPACGDEQVDEDEACDDGNTVAESCAYGEVMCAVCGPDCQWVTGATSYCGDGFTDSANAETCDDGNTDTEACSEGELSCAVCGPACTLVAGTAEYCSSGATGQCQTDADCEDYNACTNEACIETECIRVNAVAAGCETCRNGIDDGPTPPPGGGWAQCASEGETCSFIGLKRVAYGADTSFNYGVFTDGVGCNLSAFGDPGGLLSKHCWYKPAPTPPPGGGWLLCAAEGESCAFSGTKQVAYGVGSNFNYGSHTTQVDCSNASFGDPAASEAKYCWIQNIPNASLTPPPGGGWTHCSAEFEICAFSGFKRVAFGSQESGVPAGWLYANHTSQVGCFNAVFGNDPTPGYPKNCWIQDISYFDPAPPDNSGWTLCASEGQTCSFSGFKLVAYGYGGAFQYQHHTNQVACDTTLFYYQYGTGYCWTRDITSLGPTAVAGSHWTACARESQTCFFSGTRRVAYGEGNTFRYGAFTSQAPCNPSVLGDPIPGTFKGCWYENTIGETDVDCGGSLCSPCIECAQGF